MPFEASTWGGERAFFEDNPPAVRLEWRDLLRVSYQLFAA